MGSKPRVEGLCYTPAGYLTSRTRMVPPRGDILASRYLLLGEIGSGGMGTVHRAHDTRTNRVVAIKVLHRHLAQDPAYVERFRREAQIALTLDSRHIVQVLDFGHEGESHYLVMEYVEGVSLRSLLRTRGALPLPETLSIAIQVARALEEAHGKNVTHRDIKPENIMVAEDGTVKVADFGVAKAQDYSTLTITGALLGTVQYMAPEFLRGDSGPSSDIYSLGIVLYQMLAGVVPFEADTPWHVMQMHVEAEPPSLAEHGSVAGPAVERVVMRCLEKDPAQRFDSARAVRQALEHALGTSRDASAERAWPWHKPFCLPARVPRPGLAEAGAVLAVTSGFFYADLRPLFYALLALALVLVVIGCAGQRPPTVGRPIHRVLRRLAATRWKDTRRPRQVAKWGMLVVVASPFAAWLCGAAYADSVAAGPSRMRGDVNVLVATLGSQRPEGIVPSESSRQVSSWLYTNLRDRFTAQVAGRSVQVRLSSEVVEGESEALRLGRSHGADLVVYGEVLETSEALYITPKFAFTGRGGGELSSVDVSELVGESSLGSVLAPLTLADLSVGFDSSSLSLRARVATTLTVALVSLLQGDGAAPQLFRDAIQLYNQDGSLTESEVLHFFLGKALALSSDREDQASALAEFLTAISINPEYPRAYVGVGNLYYVGGAATRDPAMLERAVDMYRAALGAKLKPPGPIADARAHLGMCNALLVLGQVVGPDYLEHANQECRIILETESSCRGGPGWWDPRSWGPWRSGFESKPDYCPVLSPIASEAGKNTDMIGRLRVVYAEAPPKSTPNPEGPASQTPAPSASSPASGAAVAPTTAVPTPRPPTGRPAPTATIYVPPLTVSGPGDVNLYITAPEQMGSGGGEFVVDLVDIDGAPIAGETIECRLSPVEAGLVVVPQTRTTDASGSAAFQVIPAGESLLSEQELTVTCVLASDTSISANRMVSFVGGPLFIAAPEQMSLGGGEFAVLLIRTDGALIPGETIQCHVSPSGAGLEVVPQTRTTDASGPVTFQLVPGDMPAVSEQRLFLTCVLESNPDITASATVWLTTTPGTPTPTDTPTPVPPPPAQDTIANFRGREVTDGHHEFTVDYCYSGGRGDARTLLLANLGACSADPPYLPEEAPISVGCGTAVVEIRFLTPDSSRAPEGTCDEVMILFVTYDLNSDYPADAWGRVYFSYRTSWSVP
jgi:hypothetical protein